MPGRPRLHPNQADKQFAYRQRQKEKRDSELDQLAAWKRVREVAIAQGVLIGDESEWAAALKIGRAMETANETSLPVLFL